MGVASAAIVPRHTVLTKAHPRQLVEESWPDPEWSGSEWSGSEDDGLTSEEMRLLSAEVSRI